MKLHLDASMAEEILRQWAGEHDYSKVYEMPIFRELLRHRREFAQTEISQEDYLNELLHVDGIDMEAHRAEIERNAALIRTADLGRIAREVTEYLPPIDREMDFTIHLTIGVAGQALGDKLGIDPSPCPWFPADGSDAEVYMKRWVEPTLRHEIHHLGRNRIRESIPIDRLTSLRILARDMMQEIQSEGGAVMCENLCSGRPLTEEERQKLRGGIARYRAILNRWQANPDAEIADADWNDYYSLWDQDKPVYWMGELMCRALIESGRASGVADCMAMEPVELFDAAAALVE